MLGRYLHNYRELVALKENTTFENTIITYFLASAIPMDQDIAKVWEGNLKEEIYPLFELPGKNKLISKLKGLVSEGTLQPILQKEREMIGYEVSKGEYSVSLVRWEGKVAQKMDYISQAELLLQTAMTDADTAGSQSKKMIMLTALGILAAAVAGWLFLFIRFSKRKQQSEVFDETLKDIELIFDPHQQRELKRLIESGKIDHIYKFLIKAIKDANQTKDLFLASMSHEIRTPLNGILGFTQLLKETEVNTEQAEFISVIEKSSGNLLTIVNDILDLSKIKAQKIELESIEFDPIESFEAAVESYAAKAAAENIDFNIFLDPTLPTLLLGDPTKISQVIVNLISNAIKFTSKNGEVSVRIEKVSENEEEAEVKFSVADTGIGITKEQKGKLFQAFSQADVSTSRKYGGTGLGLSISGKLVELMGGKIDIHSILDEGSKFFFTIKFKKPTTSTRRVVEDLSLLRVGILNPQIDGDYMVNKNFEAYATVTGAKVTHYTDESLFAIKYKSELPDILFIDHKYRYRTGELERFLKFDTKIVVISTGDQKRALKQYTSRISKILYKPVNYTKTLKALSEKEEVAEEKTNIVFENVRILVAEDNLINQKLIRNVLDRLGVEVAIANNGAEALDMRMENEYDMIFMDIEMPVMGGMEASAKIISYERMKGKIHIPIVALTANALSGDREKYMSAGMDGYLSKPIQLDLLKKLLVEHFSERIVEA